MFTSQNMFVVMLPSDLLDYFQRFTNLAFFQNMGLIPAHKRKKMQLLKMTRVIKKQFKSKIWQLMAFLKKFDIKQICAVNHQDINILSNFGLRKTKKREMIGSSVKDFGSFYQKTLEPIFSKDRKTTALLQYILAY